MSLVQWENKYSVKIPEIDKQHQHLIELLNSLYDSMRIGESKKNLQHILQELITYTDMHFKTEEKYFDLYNFSKKSDHKQHHDLLRKQVIEFNEKYLAGNTTISIELMNFLKNWIQNHIMNEDMQYSEFLSEKINP